MTVLEPTAQEATGDLEAGRSLWSHARRRFSRNLLAVVGLVVLAALVAVCYGALPYWLASDMPGSSARYLEQHLASKLEPPAWAGGGAHSGLMGTDKLGRDLLGRFLVGGAISLLIGLASALIAVLIGTSVGMIAGYAGGRTDAALMRIVDVLYGLPYILLVILMRVALVPHVTAFMGHFTERPGEWANVIVLLVGIGSVSWLTMARVVRGQVLSLRDQPFVEAARALGLKPGAILLRHVLPNLVGPILVYATLTVPAAVLSESFLSFLGLGIQQPLPSWGNLAAEGVEAFNPVQAHWWLITFPCAGLSLALLCLNFVGDGLRDALDPKGR